jgi:beta-barrel assembly-enhancing protease
VPESVFQGRWSDGQTAKAVPVRIRFEKDGLYGESEAGTSLVQWDYAGLVAGAPIGKNASEALLHHRKAPRAALFLEGPSAGRILLAHAPQTAAAAGRGKVVAFGLTVTAFFILAGAFLFLGNISASKTIAGLIPDAMTDRIGLQSVEIFGPVAPACAGQPGNAALDRILARLQGSGDYGRPFKLHVARSRIANAFALPGRHIVLLSGLVKQAKSPEEVAGVIAHEMGHGIERDPETLFVRSTGMQALLELLTGQSGTQAPLTAGALLLQLRFSRAAERSADAHALEILRKARVAPKPTGDFFLRHATRDGKESGILSYLGTHPSSKERAQLFLSQQSYSVEPLLNEQEWAAAQGLCVEPGKAAGDTKTEQNAKPAR